MDFQFWIWVIIIVASLLSRAMRKPKTPNVPDQPRTDSDSDTGHKPMTFEELLREIQASKTPASPADRQEQPRQVAPARPIQQAKPIQKSYEVDYDEDLEEEEKDLETVPSKDNRSYEIYEKAKSEAFNRKSLEETLKLEDTVMKYDHFREYEEASKRSVASDILKDFKDPEGFKKAFIMSEILKRKF